MKEKSGISLIVLVITIIVITILASAVILTLSNNNPIENAKKAVDANDESIRKEAATIEYADWFLKENSGNPSGMSADKYVKIELEKQEIDTEGLLVSDDGTIITNAPSVIPNGFEYLTGTVDTGFVIKNSTDGNEFVWIPVEEGTFEREAGYDTNGSLQQWNKTSYIEPYERDGYTSERDEYYAMVASVEKYGGFYIARYEASKNETTGKAQSIKDKTPWYSITWGTYADATGGAVEAARAVYPGLSANNYGDAVSILLYGVQWDAAVRFLETNYPGISKNSSGLGDTTGTWHYPLPTGSNDKYKLNNIYDLAGGVKEWTMEKYYRDLYRVGRGGNGSHQPISYRYEFGPTNTYTSLGFRIGLYIK